MPVFEEFPYTNFHELNLDWIIQKIKELNDTVSELVASDLIKYADPIQWNITTAYEKYTIVLDSDFNAYLSMQDVPAGTLLTNPNYWQMIGNLYAYLEDEGITRQVRIKKHFRYYIDGSSGNDNNDGLSSAKAFRTIDRFLKESEKYTELRAYIISAGTYVATDCDNISNVNIHIDATVSGVKILFTPDSTAQVSVYSSHWNLNGAGSSAKMEIGVYPDNPTGLIYFDNSMVRCEYIDFLCKTAFYHCGVSFHTIEFYSMVAWFSSIRLSDGTVIKNTADNVKAIDLTECTLLARGTFTNTSLTAAGSTSDSALLNASSSNLYIASVIVQNITNKYYYGISASYSTVFCTQARLDSMNNNAVSGNNIVNSNTVITTS